jgi:CheY-like chemotaxis protein
MARVLVVDDHADNVQSLMTLLSLYGHDTQGIGNAIDIVAQVRAFGPNVVIMDLAMPGKSGLQAAKEIRASMPGNRPMLIALTGERQAGPATLPEGFNYFLTKPADINVLLALVGQARPEITGR